MTTPSKDGFAVFEQDGNKCPILHHSKLSTEIFCDIITGCQNYVTNKEIAADKQTIKVMTALKGYIWEDWVSIHVHVKLNLLSQSKNQTFHDYSTAIWNVNSLLHGMDSFLNDAKLHTCIEVGMDLTLARHAHAHDKKLHLIAHFQPWLDALKELDTNIQAERAEHHAELEAMMKSMRQKSRDDCTLSDPSCKYNASSAPSKSMPPSNVPSCLGSKDYPLKLTPEEGSFLVNNHGCTKCCKLYVFHTKFECPNNFPKGTRCKAVTQASVDAT